MKKKWFKMPATVALFPVDPDPRVDRDKRKTKGVALIIAIDIPSRKPLLQAYHCILENKTHFF